MTMKKTFRFLALSLMLLGGTLSSWASPRPATSVGPADDTRVGATVSGGVVVYKVVGWDTTLDAYQVEITGLDFDGLATNPTTLDIKTSFAEKYGEFKYNYYVTKISDAEKDTESTMQELEAAYGDQLEAAIQYYTNYNSVEEYKEYVYLSYLQEMAINDYCKKIE